MKNNVLIDGVALFFEKVVHPEDDTELVIKAFGVESLFMGRAAYGTFIKSHEAPSVSVAVIMHLVGIIPAPEDV